MLSTKYGEHEKFHLIPREFVTINGVRTRYGGMEDKNASTRTLYTRIH